MVAIIPIHVTAAAKAFVAEGSKVGLQLARLMDEIARDNLAAYARTAFANNGTEVRKVLEGGLDFSAMTLTLFVGENLDRTVAQLDELVRKSAEQVQEYLCVFELLEQAQDENASDVLQHKMEEEQRGQTLALLAALAKGAQLALRKTPQVALAA